MDEQTAMQLDAPAAPPVGPAITVITLGGSHRALSSAGRKLSFAKIPYKSLGPVALGSKRIMFAVPTRCVEQIKAMDIGAARASHQPEWLATQTEESLFGIVARQD